MNQNLESSMLPCVWRQSLSSIDDLARKVKMRNNFALLLLGCSRCERAKRQGQGNTHDNLEDDRVALLQSTVLYSDDHNWSETVQKAEVLKAKLEGEETARSEQLILKVRKETDGQGSFSANLINYLAVSQEINKTTRCNDWAACSVATSCSSLGWWLLRLVNKF